MSEPAFYITTAIDYPNGSPHMGHAYEKIISDVYARWYRFLGREVYFLTGTDENGQKLSKAAEAAGMAPQDFVDQETEKFKKLCEDLQLSNDDFIRTTEKRHTQKAQEIWKKLEAAGEIYPGEYEGHYCISCETFYTELQAEDGNCPVHSTKLESVKEKGFFFKLSKYAEWVHSYIQENPQFIRPESARNEMLRRIEKEKIRDLSVSRPNNGWGIPAPEHDGFVMYTWFDALINYYSALTEDQLKSYWPASMHVIGKDITWFHSVIWPSMLKAAGLELPKQIYVHGMVLGQDGRKMSKSLGNGVEPYEIIRTYPLDSFRYYLLRAISSGGDGAFVTADLVKRHNTELANDFGNLLMRVIKLGMKKFGDRFDKQAVTQKFDFKDLGAQVATCMENREHHRALELIWSEINRVNLYLNECEPWKIEKDDPNFKVVIYNALYGIHCFSCLLVPFLPETAQKCLSYLGTEASGLQSLEFGKYEFHLSTPEALFPKLDV